MLDRPPDKRKGRPRFADAADPNHHGKFFSIPNVPDHVDIGKLRGDDPLRKRREPNLSGLRQRLVQQLHDLGPAPLLGHFLDELGAEAGCGASIDRLLSEYSHVDPAFVRALGGDI